MDPDKITVSTQPLADCSDLRVAWLGLEELSSSSVFLSWQWIGRWIETYKPNGTLIKFILNDELVGLGIICKNKEIRRSLISSKTIRLHQTGDPLQDQIWIEYNSPLAKNGLEDRVLGAFAQYLSETNVDWDEFKLSAVETGLADKLEQLLGSRSIRDWSTNSYGVDLREIRQAKARYLDGLSKNTRYQINRSIKKYRKNGELELARPETVSDAKTAFLEMAPVHIKKWGGGAGQSGFANPQFVKFHINMIEECWESKGVDIVLIKCGGEVLGAFYNLIYKGIVYFYLSAIDAAGDKHLKPGLVGHALCIEDYKEKGFDYYDFMGGDDRYKLSLGKQKLNLTQVTYQKPRFKFTIERLARLVKRKTNL